MDVKVCLVKVGGFGVFKVYILQVGDRDVKVCLVKVGVFGVFKEGDCLP